MNFIPDVDDKYFHVTRLAVYHYIWEGDSVDIRIARDTGIFPDTRDGKKLAAWQHAFLKETSKFWEWVDDYEFHT